MQTILLQLRQIKVVGEQELALAWGAPGQPGDPIKIKETVDKIASFGNVLIDLQSDLCSQIPPELFANRKERVKAVIPHLMQSYISQFERLANVLQVPKEGRTVLRLDINLDEGTTQAVEFEIRRVLQSMDTIRARQIQQAVGKEVPSRLDELLAELNSLIGFDAVKKDVVALVNFLQVQQMRKAVAVRGRPRPRRRRGGSQRSICRAPAALRAQS